MQIFSKFFTNSKLLNKKEILNFIGFLGKTVRNTYELKKQANGYWTIETQHGNYSALYDRALQILEELSKQEKMKVCEEKNKQKYEENNMKFIPLTKEWTKNKYYYLEAQDQALKESYK